jgi:hypothetical protein
VKLNSTEAGMDLGWSPNPVGVLPACFQGKVSRVRRLVRNSAWSRRVPAQHHRQQRLVRSTDCQPSHLNRGDSMRTDGRLTLRRGAGATGIQRALLRARRPLSCRSTATRGKLHRRSRAPTASGEARRFSCCASGSK